MLVGFLYFYFLSKLAQDWSAWYTYQYNMSRLDLINANPLKPISLFLFSNSSHRNHQFMGGYLHPAHKQCSKSHSLHPDHTTLQGDPAAGLDQLQAAAAIAQQPPGPSSVLYLAGNVASSWKQPECSVPRVPGTSLWDVLHLKDFLAATCGQAKRDMRCYTGIVLSLGPWTNTFVCVFGNTYTHERTFILLRDEFISYGNEAVVGVWNEIEPLFSV